jgi:type II secretory pathway pseudopilin PulG
MDMVIVMVVSIMSIAIVTLVLLLQAQLRRNKVQQNLIISYEVIMSLWRKEKSQQRLAEKQAIVSESTRGRGVTLPPLSKTDRLWVKSYD